MNDFYINASGGTPSPNLLALAVMRSGLQWEMHPAQVFGLERLAFERSTRLDSTFSTTTTVDIMKKHTEKTLMGIPVIQKADYPLNLIRLMYEGEEVTRIECLAVPYGFGDLSEAEQESERNKFLAIGMRPMKTQETK
jgi:hypothetical protein